MAIAAAGRLLSDHGNARSASVKHAVVSVHNTQCGKFHHKTNVVF